MQHKLLAIITYLLTSWSICICAAPISTANSAPNTPSLSSSPSTTLLPLQKPLSKQNLTLSYDSTTTRLVNKISKLNSVVRSNSSNGVSSSNYITDFTEMRNALSKMLRKEADRFSSQFVNNANWNHHADNINNNNATIMLSQQTSSETDATTTNLNHNQTSISFSGNINCLDDCIHQLDITSKSEQLNLTTTRDLNLFERFIETVH